MQTGSLSRPCRSADLLVDRGRMTHELSVLRSRGRFARELAAHGGDPRATLAATMDGRTFEVMGDAAAARGAIEFRIEPPVEKKPEDRALKVVGALSPGEHESRERYTLTHLHAKGGMGRVWLAKDGSTRPARSRSRIYAPTRRTTRSSLLPDSTTKPRSRRAA